MEFVHAKRTTVTDHDITEDEEKAKKKAKEESKNNKDAPLTKSELRNVLKAMDTDGFNNIMDEYIKEISDPNNVKEQNQFLLESEKRKDLPANVKLAQPSIGFCFKTEKKHLSKPNTREKIFINVCSLTDVPEPEEKKDENSKGSHWSLPYLVNKPRNDMDSKSRHCQTFDVVFNPKAIEMAKKFTVFKKFVCDNAINGINRHFLATNKEEASLDYSLTKKYDYKGNEVSMINIHGLTSGKYDNKREPLNEFKSSIMKEIEGQKNQNIINEEREFDQVDVIETQIRNINKIELKRDNDLKSKDIDNTLNSLIPEFKIKYSDNFALHNHFYDPTSTNSLDIKETTMIIELSLSKIDEKIKLMSIAELDVKDRKLRLKVENFYDCVIELKSNLIEETLSAKWDKQKRLLIVSGVVLKANPIIHSSEITNTSEIKNECEKVSEPEPELDQENTNQNYTQDNNIENNNLTFSNEVFETNKNETIVNNKADFNAQGDNLALNSVNLSEEINDTEIKSSTLLNNSKLSEVVVMMNKINLEKQNQIVEQKSHNEVNLKREVTANISNNNENSNSQSESEVNEEPKSQNEANISSDTKSYETEADKNNSISKSNVENKSSIVEIPQSISNEVVNSLDNYDNDDTENYPKVDKIILQKISIIEFNNPLIFEIV